MLEDEARGIRDADCVVYHPKPLGGLHLAEKLGVPGFLALPAPFFTPTREFPNMLAPPLPFGGWYNRLSYSFLRPVGLPWNGLVDRWRVRDLELPRRGRLANDLVRTDGTPVPVLYCFSPSLVPPPGDWPDTATVTGFWFLDSRTEWRPPPALLEFLEAGPQPIYVGFGSMAGRRPRRLTKIVVDALARSGQRAVLASGWGGLEARELPREVHLVEEVPHDWLFPRVRAVVHHGGAGTTAAGLRAGRPSVICPFFGDQPFWGRIVERSGAGPRPIPQTRLNARRLARAIRQAVEDPAVQSAAESLGRILRAEDGVGNAVRTIVTSLERR